jgi:hypothetical protein
LTSLHARIICIKFDLNWPAGFGEDFFNINLLKNVFPIVAPSGHDLRKIQFALYQEAFMCKFKLFWSSGS